MQSAQLRLEAIHFSCNSRDLWKAACKTLLLYHTTIPSFLQSLHTMKLFAKRTKKAAAAAKNDEPRTVFQSDPVCEKLAQQDPATWNAKQRRMMKRYLERRGEAINDAVTDESAADVKKKAPEEEKSGSIEAHPTKEKEETGDDASVDDQDEDDSSSSSSSSSNGDFGDDNKSNNGNQNHENAQDKQDEEKEESKEAPSTNADMKQELDQLLGRLDSKRRRKLSRKLDRGEVTVEELLVEIKALLEPETIPQQSASNEPTQGDTAPSSTTDQSDSNTPASKSRKRKSDWSDLPPEERMRREEQRRKQQEMAARRAAGEFADSKFRHPLNSERRRANRRKPKWQRRSKKDDEGSHHASGFQMRKSQTAA